MLARVSSGRLVFRNVAARQFGASCVRYLPPKCAAHDAVVPANTRPRCFSSTAYPLRSVGEERLGETHSGDTAPNPDVALYEPDSQSAAAANQVYPPLSSLLPVNTSHTSLATFNSHAQHARLNPKTYTYLGTRYEYLAQETLMRVGLELLRIGKTGDRGVDLAGWWHLPSTQNDGNGGLERLRALVQCKRIKGKRKLTPSVVREMDGAFLGAPAGWRDEHVFGIIVSTKPATKGVISALGSSKRALVWICMEEHDMEAGEAADDDVVDTAADDTQISENDEPAVDSIADEENALGSVEDEVVYGTAHGRIIQLLYNNAARQMGLEGLDVVKRHDPDGEKDMALGDGVVLVYRGQPVRHHITAKAE